MEIQLVGRNLLRKRFQHVPTSPVLLFICLFNFSQSVFLLFCYQELSPPCLNLQSPTCADHIETALKMMFLLNAMPRLSDCIQWLFISLTENFFFPFGMSHCVDLNVFAIECSFRSPLVLECDMRCVAFVTKRQSRIFTSKAHLGPWSCM